MDLLYMAETLKALGVIVSLQQNDKMAGGLILGFDDWDKLNVTRDMLHKMNGVTIESRGYGLFLLYLSTTHSFNWRATK